MILCLLLTVEKHKLISQQKMLWLKGSAMFTASSWVIPVCRVLFCVKLLLQAIEEFFSVASCFAPRQCNIRNSKDMSNPINKVLSSEKLLGHLH